MSKGTGVRRDLSRMGEEIEKAEGKESGGCMKVVRCECGVCNNEVVDCGSEVQCGYCCGWFHRGCVKVNATMCNALAKSEEKGSGPGFRWYCSACNRGVKDMMAELREMKEKQGKMESDLGDLRMVVEGIRKEVGQVRDGEGMTEKWFDAVRGVKEGLTKVEVCGIEKRLQEEIEGVRKVVSEVREGTKQPGEGTRQADMEEDIKSLRQKVDEISESGVLREKEELQQLKRTYAEAMSKEGGAMVRVEQGHNKEIQARIKEELERNGKSKNLVIMGIGEQGDGDTNTVETIRKVLDEIVPEKKYEFKLVGR
jgi:hypothetical protein